MFFLEKWIVHLEEHAQKATAISMFSMNVTSDFKSNSKAQKNTKPFIQKSEMSQSHTEVELESVLQQQETFLPSEFVNCLLPVWISCYDNGPDRLAAA